jgi:uncharacterized protein YhaN
VAAQGDRLLESLEAKRKQRRRLVAQRKAGGNEIRNIEHGAKVQAARRTHRNVLRQSEEARLRLARNALHTVAGLSQGNARPSAWWLHAVDPSGEWFARMRATATGRVEPLMEDGN